MDVELLLPCTCNTDKQKFNNQNRNSMSYNILTETDFFKVIDEASNKAEVNKVQEAYHKFVTLVIDLCHRTTESKDALHALVFA